MTVALGEILIESHEASVTARLGDGFPNQTQGFGGWEEIEIPRRKSATVWKGRQPWRIAIPLVLDGFREDRSVEHEVRLLERMAGGGIRGVPTTVQFDSGGVVQHDRTSASHVHWVIDGFELGDAIRRAGDGDRVRQALTLTFLEYVHPAFFDRPQRDIGTQGKPIGRPRARVRRYRVKQGDTLFGIAKRFLGKASRWREIARLNAIRDPRRPPVGKVIRLP